MREDDARVLSVVMYTQRYNFPPGFKLNKVPQTKYLFMKHHGIMFKKMIPLNKMDNKQTSIL